MAAAVTSSSWSTSTPRWLIVPSMSLEEQIFSDGYAMAVDATHDPIPD